MNKTKQTHTLIIKIFSIAFFLLLWIPCIQQMTHIFPEYILDENRVRSTMGTYTTVKGLRNYFRDIEKYIGDSFGFRDTLILMKNQIDLSVFGTSDKVYINPGGYLFSKEFDDKYRTEIDLASQDHWISLFNKMVYLRDELKKQNIDVIFVPIPLADSIYPEEFPNIPYRGYGKKMYQRFYDFFDKNDMLYVDVVKELEEHKGDPLYYKTDIHFTPVGSFYVMRSMINALYENSNEDRQWDYPLKYRNSNFTDGILNTYLGTYTTFPDNNPEIERGWEVCSTLTDNIWRTSCSNKQLLPSTTIFGNSFMTLLLQNGFADEFGTLYPHLVSDLNSQVRALPSDTKVVIIEFYEIDVWKFLYGDIFPVVGSLEK